MTTHPLPTISGPYPKKRVGCGYAYPTKSGPHPQRGWISCDYVVPYQTRTPERGCILASPAVSGTHPKQKNGEGLKPSCTIQKFTFFFSMGIDTYCSGTPLSSQCRLLNDACSRKMMTNAHLRQYPHMRYCFLEQ